MAEENQATTQEYMSLAECSRREYGLDEIRGMYGTSGAVNSRGSVKIDEGVSA